MSEASEPVFDADGKYLYFFASTDAGPVKQWFDQSNADMRQTNGIYVVALTKDAPSPLAKESDEEKGAADKADKDKAEPGKTEAKGAKKDKAEPAKPAVTVAIDFDGLNERILALADSGRKLCRPAGGRGRPALLRRVSLRPGSRLRPPARRLAP